jgi:hypothetical protein
MSWSAPKTALAGQTVVASDWNVKVRDNLLQLAPASATAAFGHATSGGANYVAMRDVAYASSTSDVTVSSQVSTWTNFTGGSATVTGSNLAGAFVTAGWKVARTGGTGSGVTIQVGLLNGTTELFSTTSRMFSNHNGKGLFSYSWAQHIDLTTTTTLQLAYKVDFDESPYATLTFDDRYFTAIAY